jgi:hypothetical protein
VDHLEPRAVRSPRGPVRVIAYVVREILAGLA